MSALKPFFNCLFHSLVAEIMYLLETHCVQSQNWLLLKISTEQDKKKDQEKWHHFLKDIKSSLKEDNYDTALRLIDKFESDWKSPELHLKALMKRAESSYEAWRHASK